MTPHSKPALRAHLRAARNAVQHAAIPRWPQLLDRLAPGLVVATYLPIPAEADPAPLHTAARATGCRLALPRLSTRAAPMRFAEWTNAELIPGPFGPQPPADAPDLNPDVILAPLVGFDRRGNRLGQGGGHYDRAFAAHPHAWRVGIAWSVQEVGALTPDPWDVRLHAIATEQEWITP